MNPNLSNLISLGIAHLDEVRNPLTRMEMLRAAAPFLPDHITEQCLVAATAIELAERAQMELRGLIFS